MSTSKTYLIKNINDRGVSALLSQSNNPHALAQTLISYAQNWNAFDLLIFLLYSKEEKIISGNTLDSVITRIKASIDARNKEIPIIVSKYWNELTTSPPTEKEIRVLINLRPATNFIPALQWTILQYEINTSTMLRGNRVQNTTLPETPWDLTSHSDYGGSSKISTEVNTSSSLQALPKIQQYTFIEHRETRIMRTLFEGIADNIKDLDTSSFDRITREDAQKRIKDIYSNYLLHYDNASLEEISKNLELGLIALRTLDKTWRLPGFLDEIMCMTLDIINQTKILLGKTPDYPRTLHYY